jgi:pyruvate dehydrogenase E1 component alpha subunit
VNADPDAARLPPIERYDRDLLRHLLVTMLRIRRFEEKAAQAYGLRKIGGFCHLYIGQEAVATGAIAAMNTDTDYVLTAYRDHGHALAVGMSPDVLMAELFGKYAGCSKGKGGSMHFFDAGKRFLGGNGIVGAHLPLAAGVALRIRYYEENGVVLCFFGDGAIHQGTFHESLNLAKVWNLPVVYICENNIYGMGTSYERVSSNLDFPRMAASYNMRGGMVNGMDVLEVYEHVREAVRLAREEKTPVFLEARTYRYKGHSMSDPGRYRTRDELEEYRRQDPIASLKARLIESGNIDDDDYDSADAAAREEMEEAVAFADRAPEPPLESLYEDVLA